MGGYVCVKVEHLCLNMQMVVQTLGSVTVIVAVPCVFLYLCVVWTLSPPVSLQLIRHAGIPSSAEVGPLSLQDSLFI